MIVARNLITWFALWIFTGGAFYNTVGTKDWLAMTVGILAPPVILIFILLAIIGLADTSHTETTDQMERE